MRTTPLRGVSLWILAAGLVAACGVPTAPTAESSPTSFCPSSGAITVNLATPQPADVLLELAWEGGFTRPEVTHAFGRVPEFSLLPDGSVYYRDPSEWDQAQVMEADLTLAEADTLVQRVLDLGIERLESYTEPCQPQAGGTCLCLADAGESVLRVRLPGGELREIRNYADFANDPEALSAIRTLLEEYRHPQAQPYAPESASLFVRPVAPSSDLTRLDWPLHPARLAGGALDASCARALSGGDLQALLDVTGRNLGDFTIGEGGQVAGLYLVPWLPGTDYTDQIASSGQACPEEGGASPSTGELTSPCSQPSTEGLTPLIVEEHPLSVGPSIRELGRTAGPGYWIYFETADGDTGEILGKNQALRDVDALRLASYNALLGPFGYRLVLTQCGDPWSGQYAVYQGDRLYQDAVFGLPAVSANASGTEFLMPLQLADGSYLLTQDGLLERPDLYYNRSVYVGDELLTLTISDTVRVYLGDQLLTDIPTVVSTIGPVTQGSPWTYDGH